MVAVTYSHCFFMETLAINVEEIYREIKDRAFDESAFTREEWDGLVEQVLEDRREMQEIHDDVDWDEMKEALQARYSDFELEIPEE